MVLSKFNPLYKKEFGISNLNYHKYKVQWFFSNFEIRGKEMTRTTHCGLPGAVLMNTPRARSPTSDERTESVFEKFRPSRTAGSS